MEETTGLGDKKLLSHPSSSVSRASPFRSTLAFPISRGRRMGEYYRVRSSTDGYKKGWEGVPLNRNGIRASRRIGLGVAGRNEQLGVWACACV